VSSKPLAPSRPATVRERWWRNAVIYHIYVRSFLDSNADGIGDLPGIRSRLEYLQWLGVDAIWLSPIMVSPNRDFGYDVADYYRVDPAYGSLADLDLLIAEAAGRNIKVLLDLVPNHTSDQHPWFRDPELRLTRYVWTDRPNNWLAAFGGPAWTRDEATGRYYLHNFLPGQPDLDWWNPAVQREFELILQYWFDRGVAGFRIDVAHALVKDRRLRDNPAATEQDPPWQQLAGLSNRYSARQPEVHEIYRRWREIAKAYVPERLLMGEVHLFDAEEWAAYHGRDDELQLALNFMLVFRPFEMDALRTTVERSLAVLPESAEAVWHGSNHDVSRLATRWAEGDERRVRLALTMLLTLPGATVLYQGDEIGLRDGQVPDESVRDCATPSRDPQRTPMRWNAEAKGGFTSGEPWLPLEPDPLINVEVQRQKPGSVLNLTRELIRVKGRLEGGYEPLAAPTGVWRYRRGEVVVQLDFGRLEARVNEPE